MEVSSATLLSLALQLLVGAGLFSAIAAWRGGAWLRGARELRRAAPFALVAGGGAWLLNGWDRFELVSLAGALSTSGCYLIWRAGRLERSGRLRPARRLLRPAAGAVVLGAASLALPASLRSLGAGLLLGLAAFLAALAGLSGKPRPTGHGAILFYLFALVLLVHSTR